MFRPSKVVVKLAGEHFKMNIQIALTGNEITFLTQFIQNVCLFLLTL